MRPHIADKKGPQDIDESSDTYDTIDWLVKHVPNHNGKVGLWGISYPGFYTAAGMIDAHPALKAASPQAPIMDWFVGDDCHHNGALFLPHCFNFMANFGQPRPEPTARGRRDFDHDTPDGYDFFLRLGPLSNADENYFKGDVPFWNEVMAHGTYDEFWQARNLRPHLKNIKPAVMTVGGWFDAENLFGALEIYRNVEASSPGTTNVLVMGPWVHGGWSGGDAARRSATSASTPRRPTSTASTSSCPFFEFHLKGKGENEHPEAWVFETGTNLWRKHDAWPPKTAKPQAFYFQAGGRLAPVIPADAKGRGQETPPDKGSRQGLRTCPRVRRVHQRSGQAGAVPGPDRHRHGSRVHDRRPALRRPPPRRAGLPDARAGRRRHPRRPDRRGPARLDDRHRFGLGREADRRVPGRLPRSESRTPPASGWAATSSWCAAT